jgi:tRNA(Ile)-lysidine synthase TilS/MesJ
MIPSSSDRAKEAEEQPVDCNAGPPVTKALCSASTCSATSKKATRDSSTWGKGQAVVNGGAATNDSQHGAAGQPAVEPVAVPKKSVHTRPTQKLMKLCIQAVYQWEMIQDGDRLLLGLSGGKDSLSLLHLLLEIKKRHPIRFELEVCTIDPMTPSFDPSPLIPYVESLGLKYHYLREDIVARAASAGKGGKEVASLCSYCARMKRGKLYTCAREAKCNKLVLAQHLDDCAESFMMSVMHNGFLRTMQANYTNNAGDLTVIRPLIYCRERLMTEFAKSANLPVINENCPACFEEPKERARVKKLLSREESLFPNFFDNIRRSLIPLMHEDSTAILRSYLDETLARSNAGVPNRRKRQREENEDMSEATPESTVNADHSLKDATDDELLRELARRRADKYRLAGANKFVAPDDEEGPVCTLTSGCTILD